MESSLSKILVIVIALIVMLGGGFTAWYFLRTATSQSPITQTSPTATTDSNDAGSGTINVPVTQPSSTETSSLASAYAALFKQLSAQQVSFTPVNATTGGNTAALYKLYASDEAVNSQLYPGTTFTLGIAAVDLNNDGTPEALVYEDSQGFCGVGGCNLDIYQDQQSKWVKIASILTGSEVGISSKSTGGFADLFLPVSTNGTNNTVVRYAWDGTTYQLKQTVATWDGTTFTKI